MNLRLFLLLDIFIAFVAYTIWAVLEVGFIGLLTNPQTFAGTSVPIGGLQIAIDLVIAIVIATGFLWKDAKARGINYWPFLILTLFTGSIALLAYLIARQLRAGRA